MQLNTLTLSLIISLVCLYQNSNATEKQILNINQKEKIKLHKHLLTPLFHLKLKAQELKLKKKKSFNSLLLKLKKKPFSIDKKDLEQLSDKEFLYLYRFALSSTDSNKRIVLNNWIAHKLIDEIIRRFELEGNGYAYDNFDEQGIKEIVKYYQTINPALEKIKIKFIFTQEMKLPDSILHDKGKVLYIVDTDMAEGVIHHVTMMFINHESKQIFIFDSLGLLKPEIDSYKIFFGPSYSIYYNSGRLQHDTRNCMIFSVLTAHRILSYGNNFFSRLQSKNSSDHPLPETFIMMQSLKKIDTYDKWLSFIHKQPQETSLEEIQEKFLTEFSQNFTLEFEKAHLNSFCKTWLPLLHQDRNYLEYVFNNRLALEGAVGGIRQEKNAQEQNFYLDRLRLKYLYYMATKRI